MRFIKANRLFDGKNFLPDNSVLILNGDASLNAIVGEMEIPTDKIELLDGIITPGFVNTHCHLELSHLKEKISQHTGLVGFAKQIIRQRGSSAPEEIKECMQEADREMWRNGIVAVGDISNVEDSFAIKQNSRLYYHTFIELIGLNPAFSETIANKGVELFNRLRSFNLTGSLAPHAPYSVSNELIKFIAEFDAKNDLSFSIHNQESKEEDRFFMGEKSDFDDLYKFLNIDISYFKSPLTSSLESYARFLQKTPSILVHNTFTGKEDINSVKHKNVYWCFCPLANKYIENQLPTFTLFESNKEKICLGTDSLASNLQLDLVAEANTILRATNVFSLENILRMMTFNGAEALGISDKFGELKEGKNTGLNLLEFKNDQLHFIKKIA